MICTAPRKGSSSLCGRRQSPPPSPIHSYPERRLYGEAGAPVVRIVQCICAHPSCATRFIAYSYFCLSKGEDSPAQEYGIKEAILKYGVPRAYYVDRGPA